MRQCQSTFFFSEKKYTWRDHFCGRKILCLGLLLCLPNIHLFKKKSCIFLHGKSVTRNGTTPQQYVQLKFQRFKTVGPGQSTDIAVSSKPCHCCVEFGLPLKHSLRRGCPLTAFDLDKFFFSSSFS